MKKKLAALLCLVLLTGCTRFNVNVQTTKTEPSAASLSGEAESVAPAPETTQTPQTEESQQEETVQQAAEQPYLTVTAAEAFDGAYSFVTEETGSYRFAAEGPEGQSWEVYVLDEEFEDAPRYLPQAYEPAFTVSSGEGEKISALQGDQYVYCVCSDNAFTQDESAQSGALTVYFTAADGDSMVRSGAAGALEVDAADVWLEGGYSFQARRDATYTLHRSGEADWEIYVLNETFDDALRFLPQAYEPVAENEGSFAVQNGQVVYCLCDWNTFTQDEAPERGANVLTLEEES